MKILERILVVAVALVLLPAISATDLERWDGEA